MSEFNGGKFISGFAAGVASSLVSSGVEALGNSSIKLEGVIPTGVGGTFLPQLSSFASRNPGLFRAIMIASGELSGGVSSAIAGGKFIDGLKQGLITSGLNHLPHLIINGIETQRLNRELSLERIKQLYPRFYEVLGKLKSFLEENPNVLSNLSEDTGLTKSQILGFMDIKKS